MIKFETSADFAIKMDQNDELKSYRDSFHFPIDSNGNKVLYFTAALQDSEKNKFQIKGRYKSTD